MSVVLRGVRVVRGTFTLEIDASFTAPCTAVLGPSGSGKSTLLECIAGLARPAAGTVELHGEVMSDGRAIRVPPWRRRIGYVPQDGALFPHLSVRGNLTYGTGPEEDTSHLDGIVFDVLGLLPLLDRRVPSLSGGEKRRVALGRALLSDPRLLLLDEPLTGLDRALKSRAIELLQRVRRELAVPTVLVTHDDAEAEALADESVRLDGGCVVGGG